MCRMMFSLGPVDVNWLIDDMIVMASDQNERHEENESKQFTHRDGWGICFLADNTLKAFRSIEPIYTDPRIDQFRSVNSRLIMLHARRASRGNVVLQNVHPFEAEIRRHRHMFFHNGTVRDELTFDASLKIQGTTDSERFFYYLLSSFKNEIEASHLRRKLDGLNDFTSANFMLSNGQTSFIANWWSVNPNYYRMKMLTGPDFTIFSSEVLPHFKEQPWVPLENRDIYQIESETNRVTKC
ncbi:MAG: class II glutamine amidotransferase [Candidatus Zhuqueibacterota bacterium]